MGGGGGETRKRIEKGRLALWWGRKRVVGEGEGRDLVMLSESCIEVEDFHSRTGEGETVGRGWKGTGSGGGQTDSSEEKKRISYF